MTKNKRVLIVTQQLGSNYGGILQAFALQESLRRIGHVSVTTAAEPSTARTWLARTGFVRRVKERVLGRRSCQPLPDYNQALLRFVKSKVALVPIREARKRIRDFDAVVVGSDQVWRKPYSRLAVSFLTFVPPPIPRFSYAASFGVADLSEYSAVDRCRARRGLLRFSGVSVRESSGASICLREFGVEAIQHVDPTMLLARSDYETLLAECPEESTNVELLDYILDPSTASGHVAEKCGAMLGLSQCSLLKSRAGYSEYMPPIEVWLRRIMNAGFLVTDSFHGTVFALIFNVPFLVLTNPVRGNARLDSLLKLVGLPDRLITAEQRLDREFLHAPIDWVSVNGILAAERSRGIEYLIDQLSDAKTT